MFWCQFDDRLIRTKEAIVEWYHLLLQVRMILALKQNKYTCFDLDPETLRLPSCSSTRLAIDAAECTHIYIDSTCQPRLSTFVLLLQIPQTAHQCFLQLALGEVQEEHVELAPALRLETVEAALLELQEDPDQVLQGTKKRLTAAASIK